MRALLFLLMGLGLVGCTPKWNSATLGDGKFQVAYPSLWAQQKSQKTTIQRYTAKSGVAGFNRIYYSIDYIDVFPSTPEGLAAAAFVPKDQLKELNRKNCSNTDFFNRFGILNSAPITVKGYPGLQLSSSSRRGGGLGMLLMAEQFAEARCYFVQNREYRLYVVGVDRFSSRADAKRFFDSFDPLVVPLDKWKPFDELLNPSGASQDEAEPVPQKTPPPSLNGSAPKSRSRHRWSH